MKYTPYCMACELQLQRLFGKGNFFKCMICDKLTNALDKIEVCPCSINDISNSSIININNKNYINNTIINIIVSPFRKDGHDYSLLANRSRLNKRLGLNDRIINHCKDELNSFSSESSELMGNLEKEITELRKQEEEFELKNKKLNDEIEALRKEKDGLIQINN